MSPSGGTEISFCLMEWRPPHSPQDQLWVKLASRTHEDSFGVSSFMESKGLQGLQATLDRPRDAKTEAFLPWLDRLVDLYDAILREQLADILAERAWPDVDALFATDDAGLII